VPSDADEPGGLLNGRVMVVLLLAIMVASVFLTAYLIGDDADPFKKPPNSAISDRLLLGEPDGPATRPE
jgi:hypothetical protein